MLQPTKNTIWKFSVLVLLVVAGVCLTAAGNNRDSLKKVIRSSRQDTSRADAMRELAWELKFEAPDSAKSLCLEGLELLGAIESDDDDDLDFPFQVARLLYTLGTIHAMWSENDQALEQNFRAMSIMEIELENGSRRAKELLARINNNVGLIYENKSEFPKALKYHLKSLAFRNELGDEDGMAASYNNIGLAYLDQGDLPHALEYFFNSLKINEKMGDQRSTAMTCHNIAIAYFNQGEYHRALEYYNRTVEIFLETGEKRMLADSYNNLGVTWMHLNDYSKAAGYYLLALEMEEELNDRSGISYAYDNLGHLFIQLYTTDSSGKDLEFEYHGKINRISFGALPDSAMKYEKKALAIDESLNDNYHRMITLGGIANIYGVQKNYRKSIETYLEVLNISQNIGDIQKLYDVHSNLSHYYLLWGKAVGDQHQKADLFEKSLFHHEQYSVFKDSVINDEKSLDIGKLEGRFEFEMNAIRDEQAEEERLKLENEKKERRNNLQYSAIVIALFVVFGTVFIMGKMTLPKWAAELAVFLPFLLFFEFLLVLTDPWADRLTGGEPGYKLLLNVALAGLIFPIHNFFEHFLKKRLFGKGGEKE